MQAIEPPALIIVRGVVYQKRIISSGPRRGVFFYLRYSVPPDAFPGKRSRWPAMFGLGVIPEDAQLIDEDVVEQIKARSLWSYLERAGT